MLRYGDTSHDIFVGHGRRIENGSLGLTLIIIFVTMPSIVPENAS